VTSNSILLLLNANPRQLVTTAVPGRQQHQDPPSRGITMLRLRTHSIHKSCSWLSKSRPPSNLIFVTTTDESMSVPHHTPTQLLRNPNPQPTIHTHPSTLTNRYRHCSGPLASDYYLQSSRASHKEIAVVVRLRAAWSPSCPVLPHHTQLATQVQQQQASKQAVSLVVQYLV
jgi:hypothetical protein